MSEKPKPNNSVKKIIPGNPVLLLTAFLFYLSCLICFGIAIYFLFQLEDTAPLKAEDWLTVEKIAESSDSFYADEAFNLTMFHHFAAPYIRPAILAGVAVVLFIFGLVISAFSRPIVHVIRPSIGGHNVNSGQSNLTQSLVAVKNILSSFQFSIVQWFLVIISLVLFFNYSPLWWLSAGLLGGSIWYRFLATQQYLNEELEATTAEQTDESIDIKEDEAESEEPNENAGFDDQDSVNLK